MLSNILQFINKALIDLKINQQRILIAFHCENAVRHKAVDFFTASLADKNTLIISNELKNAIPPARAATKLGEEYELVIFDVPDTINPDALGVVSGVLCGGGCLLLILPEKTHWQNDYSLFKQHVDRVLKSAEGVYYFSDERAVSYSEYISPVQAIVPAATSVDSIQSYHPPYLSYDQQHAVQTIAHLLQNKSSVCCVLTSGRGRGKSSALGLLSAKILHNNEATILLTAPRLSVAGPVFYQLSQQCLEGASQKAGFVYKKSSLSFMAPDALLERLPAADVLLVDEAAVIPISMLKQLLLHYPRIVFSTTTHGYEGTGRGFVLKFYKLLDQLRAGWERLELHQPIRWSKNDPLEKCIERLLFLNLRPTESVEMPGALSDCQFTLINRETLTKSSAEQSAIFSLLVFAHYRTSPADFQYLLDSPDIRIYVLKYCQQVLAVLVVNQEGGFDSVLSGDIYRGERRPRGHLLAQTLCFHAGYESAACLRYARVMRIAVHPELQRRGLGSYLLQKVVEQEKALGLDIIGSSFSATPELADFWHKAGFSMLRMGFSRDHVTAAHSAVVGKALSSAGACVTRVLAEKFQRNLCSWINGSLADLSDEMKLYLAGLSVPGPGELSDQDWLDIRSFALFNRNYEACMPAIERWLHKMDLAQSTLSTLDREIIDSRMQMNHWADIVSTLNLSGKKAAIKQLRLALRHLLKSEKHQALRNVVCIGEYF
ncbi:tRNA cytosine(34) acetyltransferase [hydrothermal vent metagenome]|uniref:tRNA cytosine(34) acetyltransferase n=1 Tax=hydrothermal vent metagenome TaxID=652676 RepID=A0A3B0Y506_9ZZZZ